MEDLREDEWLEEPKKKKKEKRTVTRKEFYICFLVICLLLFWQGIQIKKCIQRESSLLESSYIEQLDRLEKQISSIPGNMETALLEAENPLREGDAQIIAVDMKGKTVTLRMMALPKEYQEGMGAKFFLSCDGAEAIEAPAAVGADRAFTAEVQIPFCEEARITVSLQKGDTESIQNIGVMTIEGQVLPSFNGFWNVSGGWYSGTGSVAIDGKVNVDIQKPDWMRLQKQDFSLKKERVEVHIDGKRIKTVSAEISSEDRESGNFCYQAVIAEKDKIKLKEGQTVAFLFKAEDNNGLTYSYLVERGTWNREDGFTMEEPGAKSSRLTVE